jgi:hypothetical protein
MSWFDHSQRANLRDTQSSSSDSMRPFHVEDELELGPFDLGVRPDRQSAHTIGERKLT